MKISSMFWVRGSDFVLNFDSKSKTFHLKRSLKESVQFEIKEII